ncbi:MULTISPECIES: winged helix-turn-helix transcriptional regulator [Streptomyces]|uniref:winged helix-turn-helix transcriptional regulator n=1 Tax=Streptomyces TaxID=1883 RepID=UPI000D68282A|nr:helix-turn-helix domain-containing protein [Streptomyces sp. NWU49]PWJ02213.1 transcriptional regulator [Streptomyces sp. NWU49]
MATADRSHCPINLTVEILGDRWTLLVLRDIIFADRRHFRELLRGSEEHITSSILADRLERLTTAGILTREDDPTHRQKARYTLTQKGIALVPVIATVAQWGATHCPADPEKTDVVAELAYELPAAWTHLMDTLRSQHLPGETIGS